MKRLPKTGYLIALILILLALVWPTVYRFGSLRYHLWRVLDKDAAPADRARSLKWLAERRPKEAIVALTWDWPQRLVTVTGDYERVVQPGETRPPLRLCLDLDEPLLRGDFQALLHRQCELHTGAALRTGDLIAEKARAQGLDPALCLAENLLASPEPGCRAAAYYWLTRKAGFPQRYDWRAPNRDAAMAMVGPERARLLQSEGLAKREATVAAWRKDYAARLSAGASSGRR